MPVAKLNDYIDRNRPHLCQYLQTLVRIPTVNPPGTNYAEIVNLLAEWCRELDLETEIHHVPTDEAQIYLPHASEYPRMNLIAKWHTGAERTVHFNSHFDVVPASDGWSQNPFDPQIDGDWLYGRGSDDMKDSIAATLFAIQTLRENGVNPSCNIECSFTCDEEIGGQLGAGEIVRKQLVDADFVVNCEGGTKLNIGCGHNGILWADVFVFGKPAHGSRPHTGLNAFEKMSELVVALQSLKSKFNHPDLRFKTPAGRELTPTINIGGVFEGTSGGKINTVPSLAKFSIDRRVTPSEIIENIEPELRTVIQVACQSIPDLKAELRPILSISPCFVSSDSPPTQSFRKTVSQLRQKPAQFDVTSGFTDLHYFVEGGKIPGIGYGPWGQNAHGIDERVSISDLILTTKIYAQFMANGQI